MSKSPIKKKQKRASQKKNLELFERKNERYDAVFIPESDYSENSDSENSGSEHSDSENLDSESDFECDSEWDTDSENSPENSEIPKVSYHQVLENYEENQSKLKPDHNYEWVNGEKKYDQNLQNEILLSEKIKSQIRNYSFVQLFELFFLQN